MGEKGSDLWVTLLRRAGLPIAEKLTARETLERVWYWVRVERWPPVPLMEKKESLMRSAQARIDYGCVLHVTGARSESNPEAVDLLFMVRSGVQKSKVHKVRVEYLGDGEAGMPLCDCVNSNLRTNWKWCAHMLVVVFATERVQLGFERIVYSDTARDFVSDERQEEFLHLAQLYQVKEAERMVRGRLEELAKSDGSWATSKIAYLRSFSLRSVQVEDVAIHVHLLAPGEAKRARKPYGPRKEKAAKVKKSAKPVSEEPPNDRDDSADEEGAAVPKRKDRSVSKEEYAHVLAQNAGQKPRKRATKKRS